MRKSAIPSRLRLELLLLQLQNLEIKLAFRFFELSDLPFLGLYKFGHLINAAVLEAALLLHGLQTVECFALVGLRPGPFFLGLRVLGAEVAHFTILFLQGQLTFIQIRLQLLRVLGQLCDLICLLLLIRLCLLQFFSYPLKAVLQLGLI